MRAGVVGIHSILKISRDESNKQNHRETNDIGVIKQRGGVKGKVSHDALD